MGNCLFLRARGWGIDLQVSKKLQTPRGMPGGEMVTGRIEPCIKCLQMFEDLKQADRRPLLKLELKSGYFFLPGLCTFFESN